MHRDRASYIDFIPGPVNVEEVTFSSSDSPMPSPFTCSYFVGSGMICSHVAMLFFGNVIKTPGVHSTK